MAFDLPKTPHEKIGGVEGIIASVPHNLKLGQDVIHAQGGLVSKSDSSFFKPVECDQDPNTCRIVELTGGCKGVVVEYYGKSKDGRNELKGTYCKGRLK